ncbi:hypothetical protein QRY07_12055 [Bacillus cereus]|uniref:hypothetical protein n=1 Tax=Bacillus cereus TaxID=1396 RepID=UPI002571241F|nr:hypothetical protein [Bacillus cereus]WJE22419.1 hypothetical protein QRY07_12055 [Bacillus cereus]
MLFKVKVDNSNEKNATLQLDDKKIKEITFKKLRLVEANLEEFLEGNIQLLTLEQEYDLMIVGKQVVNNQHKRTDLVALDSDGNIVIIEIKRDIQDMKGRIDNFESQAIRYASSFTKRHTVEDLVDKVYKSYLFNKGSLTLEAAKEKGIENIKQFLTKNGVEEINNDQRIILVASSFDESVLSASAWLNIKGVDISCFEITPYEIESDTKSEYMLNIKRVLPLETEDAFLSDINNIGYKKEKEKTSNKKHAKLVDMIDEGVVHIGDTIYNVKNERETTATIVDGTKVEFKGELMTLNQWATQLVKGNNANAYMYAFVKEKQKTLHELRKEYNSILAVRKYDPIE